MGMNIVVPNQVMPALLTDQFFPVWKNTRALKATGWVYKGSGDGTTAKDTTGSPLNDQWGPSGIIAGHIQLGSQTGASATISTISNNVVTITGLTGMTAASVGHALTLSGALNASNNGTFTIVAFVGATSVKIFNANPAANESTSLTWSERVTGTASLTFSAPSFVREQTITGLTGMTTNSPGHYLNIDGAINSGNNGIFKILKFLTATSVVIINTTGVAETTSVNWTELDPLLDTYPIVPVGVSGSGAGTGANIGAINGNFVTINFGASFSGLTQSMVGHALNFSGAAHGGNNGTFIITQVLSTITNASSVVIFNPAAVAGDTNITWNDTVGLTFGGWIIFQGPSSLKIPINAVAIGNFIRGENVTQSVSGAQGEAIGYQFDVPSNQGYMVIMPRLDGYGLGRHGWSTTASTITGNSSGATVTTGAATPVEYVRETVFWKGSSAGGVNFGNIFHCVVDAVGESTSRLTSFLTATGCTTTVCPGGGGTNNGFPTNGNFVPRGQSTLPAGVNWIYGNSNPQTAVNFGRTHIISANADYTSNTSADGTFTIATGLPSVSPGAYIGFAFHRVENNEDGDVDPYVWYVPGSGVNTFSENRIGNGTVPALAESYAHSVNLSGGSSLPLFKGWRRRGFPTFDMMQNFQPAALALVTSSGASPLIYNFSSDNDQIATSLASFPPRVRDQIWIVSTQVTFAGNGNTIFGKMRKGTLRWVFTATGYQGNDTVDGKKWVQLSDSLGAWIVGPWDGVTIPLQT